MEILDLSTRFIRKYDCIAAWKRTRKKTLPVLYFKHEGYEIILVREGGCELCVEERAYRLAPPDMAFISDGEYHHMKVEEHCTYDYMDFRPSLIFSHPDLLDRFLRPFLNGRNGGTHKWTPDEKMVKCMDDLISAMGTKKNNMVRIAAGVIALVEQFDRVPHQDLGPLEDKRQRLRPAVDLIYREYQEDLQVDKMASACSMSRTTFYRHFTDVYGKNPKKFLNDLRFDYAVNLLKTSDRKITDIALSTGFFNLSHFNRLFLRKCGLTPRAYREKNRTM